MTNQFSVPAKSGNDSVFPMDETTKVDILADILNDLLAELVNDGRMTLSEERMWRGATDAVVMNRPELATPGGQVVDAAERFLFNA